MSFFKPSKKSLAPLTDEEIVERVLKHGEQSLLEVLYDRYSAKVYHKCLALVKDRELAKDCAHDIMVKIFLNLVKFEGRSAFSLWVHSITYNFCIDLLKKQKRLAFNTLEDQNVQDISDDQFEVESKEILNLQLDQLARVFSTLDPEDRLLLMMRYQDDMPVKKIAETLQISESATKMRLKRSRDHLAESIEALRKKEDNEW
jgi:RNA polymerase sigma factor (sigma-70 family)